MTESLAATITSAVRAAREICASLRTIAELHLSPQRVEIPEDLIRRIGTQSFQPQRAVQRGERVPHLACREHEVRSTEEDPSTGKRGHLGACLGR